MVNEELKKVELLKGLRVEKLFNKKYNNISTVQLFNHLTCKSVAFTLAEVLITLGIIGVVAAMTIPVLIQKHNNMVVETRLKKIYTVMNQAILLSETENGPKEEWDFSDNNFWDKYFAPHVKVVKDEIISCNNDRYKCRTLYLPDGSLLIAKLGKVTVDEQGHETVASGGYQDYYFFPNAKNFSQDEFNYQQDDISAKSMFVFKLSPNNISYYLKGKGFQPYAYILEQDLSNLLTGNNYSCNENAQYKLYCVYYIYLNGWKIPDEYPFKVK